MSADGKASGVDSFTKLTPRPNEEVPATLAL
jgi:hypothetical protein